MKIAKSALGIIVVCFCIHFSVCSLRASNITYHDNVAFADFPADLQVNASLHAWEDGFLDVTQAPFGADNTGTIDATTALQKAIDYGYDCNLVVFFPEGTYRVSGQLRMIHLEPDTGPYSQTKFVHKLVGSTKVAKRPIIKLVNNSAVADDILMYFRYEFLDGTADASRHYGAELRNIDIDMGTNPDITAVSMSGAQYCVMENVAITGDDFKCGILNLPGSGGSVRNIKITGGQTGINQSAYRPNPTIVGLTLSGQSIAGIRVGECRGSLNVIGFSITGSSSNASFLPINLPNNYNIAGSVSRANLNLIDGKINFPAVNGTAIFNKNADVMMKNVFVKAGTIIESGTVNGASEILACDVSKWYRIPQYNFVNGSDNSHINMDGTDMNPLDHDLVMHDSLVWSYPNDDLVRKHICQYFPTHEESVVNVCTDYSVTRDDDTDDDAIGIQQAVDDTTNPAHANYGKTVFIPRGMFHTSQPIVLKAGVKFVGAGNHISVIHANRTWKPATETQIIQTVSATAGKPIYLGHVALIRTSPKGPEQEGCQYVGLLKVDYYKTFIKDIQAGSLGYSDKWFDTVYAWASYAQLGPNAGGKWYNCVLITGFPSAADLDSPINPQMANLKVSSTHDFVFYNTSVEHAGDAGLGDRYIDSAQNLYMIGMKHESRSVIDIIDSSNILITGGSGNLTVSATTPDPLIYLDGCSDIEVSMLTRKQGSSESAGYSFLDDGLIALGAYENIALYRDGNAPLTVPAIDYEIEDLDLSTAFGFMDDAANLTTSGGVGLLTSASVLTHSVVDDFELSLDMQTSMPGAQNWFVGHVYFRHLDADNHYLIRLEPNGALKLFKEVNGVASVLQTVWNTGLVVTDMNHFRIVARGSVVKIYATAPSGTEQLLIDSSSCGEVLTGRAGVFARTSSVGFDNFLIKPLLD